MAFMWTSFSDSDRLLNQRGTTPREAFRHRTDFFVRPLSSPLLAAVFPKPTSAHWSLSSFSSSLCCCLSNDPAVPIDGSEPKPALRKHQCFAIASLIYEHLINRDR